MLKATNVREVNSCRLCRSSNIQVFADFGSTSPANAYAKTRKEAISQERYPLQLFKCLSCQAVQLKHDVNPEILFKNYKYASSTVLSLADHFKSYAISLIAKGYSGKVLEIGSNDGILLKELKDVGFSVVGVDPSENLSSIANSKGLKTYPDFFNESVATKILKEEGKFNLITAHNSFAHIPDIHTVMKGILQLIDKNGVFVFENAYLLDMFDKLYFEMCYFEHYNYFCISALKHFIESYGMEIFDVEHTKNQGGSIRVYCKLINSNRAINSSVDKFLEREEVLLNRSTYEDFTSRIDLLASKFKSFLNKELANKKTFSVYGAPARLTTFSSVFGLDSTNVKYAVEDSKLKIGLFTPTTGIKIVSRDHFSKKPTDFCIISAWNYSKNIILNNLDYIENGGAFIICVPDLKIIDKNNWKSFIDNL